MTDVSDAGASPGAASGNPASRKGSEPIEAAIVDPRIDAEHRAWVHALPVLRLTLRECAALPEYSCSNPTGTTPGKMWRRLDGSFDHYFKRQGGKPRWVVCQYDPKGPDIDRTIGMFYFRPVIMVTAELAQPIAEKAA